MEKKNWLSFINTKLRSQISLDGFLRAETWGFALVAFFALGAGFQAVAQSMGAAYLYETKILFLVLGHILIGLFFYLPILLEKGAKPVSRGLGIRHFTGLILSMMMLVLVAVVLVMLSYQVLMASREREISSFFMVTLGANLFLTVCYLILGAFFFVSLGFFPQGMARLADRFAKAVAVMFGVHLTAAFLLALGYSEMVAIGGQRFFEEFRLAGIFWTGLLSLLFFVGSYLRESPSTALSDLELEVAFGKLERSEDILVRYKEAFVSPRLGHWLSGFSHAAASHAHQIAAHAHEAVQLVGQKKPTELDLRKVEEEYKRADLSYRKLEKDYHRYLVCVSFFEVAEADRAKMEELRDLFSKELRNAKIELASVRQRIDEKLVSLKNTPPPAATEVPVEKVPLAR